MKVLCSVSNCNSKSKNVKVFKIGKKRQNWLSKNPLGWKSHVVKYICVKHFECKFVKTKERTVLHQNAIPTLYDFKSCHLTSVGRAVILFLSFGPNFNRTYSQFSPINVLSN